MKRRSFLETTAGATLAVATPAIGGLWAWPHSYSSRRSIEPPGVVTLRDPRMKALALTALDAAHSAGAGYADVRLTATTTRALSGDAPFERIDLGLSVRALVDGYWGWAGTPYLAETEAPRVGRDATRLAQANAAGRKPRHVEWGTIPVVRDGSWTSPCTIDPFEVAVEEINDYLNGLVQFTRDLGASRGDPTTRGSANVNFARQERLFASSEGSYLAQTVIVTSFSHGFQYKEKGGGVSFQPAQAGWEYVYDAPVRELVRQEMDRIDRDRALQLPIGPIEIGRYDIVVPAEAMATLLGETLGYATELDRALGYEANAGGTSYLGPDPLAVLGTPVAASLLTLTADRSTPKALATIGWDDDGVAPEPFTLVKDGILVDYQTTREQAAWLAPWYQKQGRPIRSHGCAMAPSALEPAMQHTPNLAMRPGTADLGFWDMIGSLEHGLMFSGLGIHMDFQRLNGLVYGDVVEVRRGKPVAVLTNAALLFHTPDLWKSLTAIGGAKHLQWFAHGTSEKGEPSQTTEYSIAAVPALFKQLAVIDAMRKA